MPSVNHILPVLLLLGASTMARPLALGGNAVGVAPGGCVIGGQVFESPVIALKTYKADGSGCPTGVSFQEYESRLLECISQAKDRGSEGRNSGFIDVLAFNTVASENAKDDIFPSSPGILSNAALNANTVASAQGNADNQKAGPGVSIDKAIAGDSLVFNTAGDRTGNSFPAGSNGTPSVDNIPVSNQNLPNAQAGDPAQTGDATGQAKVNVAPDTPRDSASASDNGKAAASLSGNADQSSKPTNTNDRAGVIVSGGATDKPNEAKDRTDAITSLGKAAEQKNQLAGGNDQTGVLVSVDEAVRPANRGGADDRINIVAVGKGADGFIGSNDQANSIDSFAGTENIAGGALGKQVISGLNAKCSCGEGN